MVLKDTQSHSNTDLPVPADFLSASSMVDALLLQCPGSLIAHFPFSKNITFPTDLVKISPLTRRHLYVESTLL